MPEKEHLIQLMEKVCETKNLVYYVDEKNHRANAFLKEAIETELKFGLDKIEMMLEQRQVRNIAATD